MLLTLIIMRRGTPEGRGRARAVPLDPEVPAGTTRRLRQCLHPLVAPPWRFAMKPVHVADTGNARPLPTNAIQHAVQDLPDDMLVYLLGSRYCETDGCRHRVVAVRRTPLGWPRVQAICAMCIARSRSATSMRARTARPRRLHEERVGVCRDYAHLAIALCRCMNIPARYCTGYLGDIGVPLRMPDGFLRLVRGVSGRRVAARSTPATIIRASGAS